MDFTTLKPIIFSRISCFCLISIQGKIHKNNFLEVKKQMQVCISVGNAAFRHIKSGKLSQFAYVYMRINMIYMCGQQYKDMF